MFVAFMDEVCGNYWSIRAVRGTEQDSYRQVTADDSPEASSPDESKRVRGPLPTPCLARSSPIIFFENTFPLFFCKDD